MSNRSGLSTSSTIGIVFIVLKLVGVIHWSWFWVLSPFWLPFFIVGFFLTALYALVTESWKERVVIWGGLIVGGWFGWWLASVV